MHQPWQVLAHRVAGAVVLAAGSLLLGGCALLFNPQTRSVPITSVPTGAEVWIDGQLVGMTPITVQADGRSAHHVEVKSGGQSKAWFLEPQWTKGSTLGAAGDVVLLLAGGASGVFSIAVCNSGGGAFSLCTDRQGGTILGVVLIGVGLTPLVVDGATGSFNAVPATKLEATFK